MMLSQAYFEHNTFDNVTPYYAWSSFDAGSNDLIWIYDSYIHHCNM